MYKHYILHNTVWREFGKLSKCSWPHEYMVHSNMLLLFAVTVVWWEIENTLYAWTALTVFFQNQGTHFLSRLAEARRRPVLSCLVLLCLVRRKINHSHTCSWLLAKLFAIGLHTVLGNHQISAKYEMDIYIHWKSWYVENYQKSRQGKTRQNQARHGRYKVFYMQYTRKITVAYIKYFVYNAICWNNVAYCITWCNKLGTVWCISCLFIRKRYLQTDC